MRNFGTKDDVNALAHPSALPLLGERAGVRASFWSSIFGVGGGLLSTNRPPSCLLTSAATTFRHAQRLPSWLACSGASPCYQSLSSGYCTPRASISWWENITP